MSAPLFVCDVCREPRQLFARVREKLLCAACWRRAGSPFPAAAAASADSERAARERMLARGGPDAYRVKAGRT